jgi:hypothetical protein
MYEYKYTSQRHFYGINFKIKCTLLGIANREGIFNIARVLDMNIVLSSRGCFDGKL